MIEYDIPTYLNSYDKLQIDDEYIKLDKRFYGFEKIKIDNIEKVRLNKANLTKYDRFPLSIFILYEILFVILLFSFDINTLPVPSIAFYTISGACATGLGIMGYVYYKFAKITIETVGSEFSFKANKKQAKEIADKF